MGIGSFLESLTNSFTHSTEDTLKDCRKHPVRCLGQLMVDGLVIICAYSFLLYVVDGQKLAWPNAFKFYGLFIFVAFVMRYLDVDFQDQLTRVAGFQLGTKLFMALAA